MIILFYSEHCEFCKKILEYISKNNLQLNFNLINIYKLAKIPQNITVVPTIIDPTIEAPLEGKTAFEYIINQKYFYHPTNNIDYWINTGIPKPIIDEDKKAIERHNFGFASIDDNVKPVIVVKDEKKIPVVTDKKSLALLKLRKR